MVSSNQITIISVNDHTWSVREEEKTFPISSFGNELHIGNWISSVVSVEVYFMSNIRRVECVSPIHRKGFRHSKRVFISPSQRLLLSMLVNLKYFLHVGKLKSTDILQEYAHCIFIFGSTLRDSGL